MDAPRIAAVALALLLASPVPARGQSQTGGSIAGTVVDASGSVVPGATVTGTNTATGLTRRAISDASGAFSFLLLPIGPYTVTAELAGFAPTRHQDLTVELGKTLTLRIEMKIATVIDAITVAGDAPLVDPSRSEVSSVVQESAIRNLPVNGRNFIDFTLLTPGVTRDVRTGDISFAGQRGTLNSLVVDGVDNNNTFFNQAAGRTGSGRAPYQFSQDAVEQFQVNANSYLPEYGRAGGAVINVITKSGTNDLHGSVFEFFRDRSLNETPLINKINKLPKPPYSYHQFGGTVGGPIVRAKHFYFGNYDGQRNTQPNDVFLNLVGTIPADAATQAAITTLRSLAESYTRSLNQDVYLVKTDHQITAGNRLSLRYNRQRFAGVNYESGGAQIAAEHSGTSFVNTDSITAQLVSARGSKLANEFRFQFLRDDEHGTANTDRPEAIVRQNGQTVLQIGRNFFSPRGTIIDRYQMFEAVSLVRGRHTVKIGADLNIDLIENFIPLNFAGTYTFQSLASFANGIPNGPGELYLQGFPGPGTSGPYAYPDSRELALFAGDEWQLGSALTLNLGARYDLQSFKNPGVRIEDSQLLAAGIDTSKVPLDKNNLAPRLGFAWAPSGAHGTVVRGGYGIFYGRINAATSGTAFLQNGMNIRTLSFTGSSVPTYPNNFASPPAGGQSSLPTILVFQPGFQNPQVHQANVGVERALGRNFAVAATLLYVSGRDLQRSIDINVGGASTATILADGQSVAYMRFNPAAKPFSNFARVIQFQDTAKSNYKGLTVAIKKRYSHRFEGNVSYTLGKVMDDVPDSTAVAPGSFDDAKIASNPADTQADYTVGNNDQRHRLVVSGMLSIPIPSGLSEPVVRALLGGFSVSGILTAQSGLPYSAALGATDLNLDGNNRSDVAPGFRRNSFRLPSTWTLDLRLTREIPMAGRARVLLMAEAFNATNRGNVIAERNTYYALRSGALAQLSDFGSILGSGDPRIVQLAAKLVW